MKNQFLKTNLLILLTSFMANSQEIVSKIKTLDQKWWKEAIVYQIYPRSFKDSNGDGIGDIQGIISKLDYIKSLGIDAVWLNPIYQSPNDDNGYDISDYQAIMKDFGTMQDFDELLKGLHDRGIKVVMDLVVNHCSDEHFWFQESRKSRDNKYRNYFYWWPAEKGTPPYRWSWFDVNSNAWKYDQTTNAYYLHYFSKKQPDLNWNNPDLRQEIYSMMDFWLAKGIDGFRMDAFQFISKDDSFPELPKEIADKPSEIIKFYGNGPHLHEYIQEMNKQVLSKYPNVMTVSEGAGDSPEAAMKFVDPARNELNMAYHFESVDVGRHILDFGLVKYKNIFERYDQAFKDKGWLSIFLANHDQPRMVSKFGNDTAEYREISSKMLSTFILTMRGTSYYFQGDELAMNNIRFDNIDDYKDVETRNKYTSLKEKNGDLAAFLEGQKQTARENGRTPFQWDATQNAGFSTGKPWLKVNPNYTSINVQNLEKNPNSTLHFFRKLTALRKQNPVLVYGTFTILDKNNPNVFAYQRVLDHKKMIILLNFSNQKTKFYIPFDLKNANLLTNNYNHNPAPNQLLPYQALVFEIEE